MVNKEMEGAGNLMEYLIAVVGIFTKTKNCERTLCAAADGRGVHPIGRTVGNGLRWRGGDCDVVRASYVS
jgi:hypothetical protein